MSALLLLLASLPAAVPGPLSVRLLASHQTARAELTFDKAGAVGCDGAAVGGTKLTLLADGRSVRLGSPAGRSCDEVRYTGSGFSVALGDVTRRYRGALVVGAAEGELVLTELVEVDDYLPGVVGAEQQGGPLEALKAQAVVSRTFAIASRGRHARAGYDVCDLAHCQVYGGQSTERDDARAAVSATRGQALLLSGVFLKPTYFHASCGGATSSAADVFGEEGVPGAVVDAPLGGAPYCAKDEDYVWEWSVPRVELARELGLRDNGAPFEALRRDAAGRVLQLRTFGQRLSGAEFLAKVGRAFGYSSLKSMKVGATEVEGVLTFRGQGLGHGVGMCQRGARAQALAGREHRKILQHYFPGYAVRPAP